MAAAPSLITRTLLETIRHLPPRPPTLILDSLSPTPSHLLSVSLSHQLPRPYFPAYFHLPHGAAPSFHPPSPADAVPMPAGHHLVYFPPQLDPRTLMPDGTDPAHSPGGLFTRRMWAGGSVEFAAGWQDRFRLDGRQASCIETVGQPELRLGTTETDEKLFVDVTRRYYAGNVEGSLGEIVHATDGAPEPVITEVRRLVFLRSDAPAKEGGRARGPLRAPPKPAFLTTIQPDRTLLFHFSALTFNAHAIHLDREYTRMQERHRDLLVHGPLSLLLMLSALQSQAGDAWHLAKLDYRNLAPLYVDNKMSVCMGSRVERTQGTGEEEQESKGGREEGYATSHGVWVTDAEGGLAVRGTATLVPRL